MGAFEALVIASTVLYIDPVSAYATTQYYTSTGNIDGNIYTLKITGDTTAVTGSTYYAKRYCARSATTTGTYISSSFIGYKTVTATQAVGYDVAAATVRVPSTATDRFTSATCVHKLDGWSKTSKATIR